jgi:DNA replication protein DnaC
VVGLDETDPGAEKLARSAEWFIQACLRDYRDKGHWLVVAGGMGIGKTHAAKRVCRYIGDHQIDRWARGWFTATQIFAPVWIHWGDAADWESDFWEDFLRHEVKPARCVVIDDMGAEANKFKGEGPRARLKALLDVCESKWLFATTNVPKREWEEKWDRRVADRLSKARYMTLFEMASFRGQKDRATPTPLSSPSAEIPTRPSGIL